MLEDRVLPFQVDKLDLRGRVVRLGPSVQTILKGHSYPAPIEAILAEAMGLTVALASGLKYEGIFSLQAISEGDDAGPIKALVSDITSEGGLRGYVGYDKDKLAALAPDAAPTVTNLLGDGRLAFTVDQGRHTQPYQGITPLDRETLSECVHTYFKQSEQLATDFKIAVGEEGITVVMIQRLPGTSDDEEQAKIDWDHAVIMLQSLTEKEMLDPELGLADLPYRLYHEDGVRVYETSEVRQECRCSVERLESMLMGMPVPELDDMMEEGGTTVTCHFCSKDYEFSADELGALKAKKEELSAAKH